MRKDEKNQLVMGEYVVERPNGIKLDYGILRRAHQI